MASNYNGNGGYTSSSSIGNFSNLPPGFSNAGGGADNAYTRTVQPNELTSYQLNGLVASNSPYIQQARQQAMNAASGRGLLNSSMAAGNAQAAAIQAALPIAQQNAAAYGTASGQNQEYLNQILNSRIGANASMYNADTAANASMHNNDANIAFQGTQAGLNRGFQDYMAQQAQKYGLQNQAFSLGASMLNSNNNFYQNAYLQGMNNPFAINDPTAFQGYLDRATQNSNSYYGNLFGYATNAGQPSGNWYENTNYYSSPYGGTSGQYNYSQNPYGDYYGSNYAQQNYAPNYMPSFGGGH